MTKVVAATALVLACAFVSSAQAAGSYTEVPVKVGVETRFEVAEGASLGIKLKPRDGAALMMTICNTAKVDGQFGLVMPVALPPPVAVGTLKAGECKTVRGGDDLAVWGRPTAWTGTVVYK